MRRFIKFAVLTLLAVTWLGPVSAASRTTVTEEEIDVMVIEAQARQASILFSEGAYAEACDVLSRILTNDAASMDQKAVTHFNRGRCLVAQDEHFDAIDEFSSAIALGVKPLGLAFFERGLAYERMKRYDQAAFDYVKAFAYEPDNLRIRTKVDRFFSEL